jgi:hypothetical protein
MNCRAWLRCSPAGGSGERAILREYQWIEADETVPFHPVISFLVIHMPPLSGIILDCTAMAGPEDLAGSMDDWVVW